MILIGIEDCPTCKVAKGLLVDVKYVELQRTKPGQVTEPEVLQIKKALGKLNQIGKFPVIFSDDLTKMIGTDVLLNNLQKQKLEDLLLK